VTTQLLIAGFGGQGILFAGKFLATAALIEGRQVSWYPSYGPEMRGGTANCSIIISDEPIGAPIVLEPDILVAMNGPSYAKFADAIKPGGMLLADSSLVREKSVREDIKAYYIPATQMATDEDLETLANMILLGKMLEETNLLAPETVEKAMALTVPPRKEWLLKHNLRAIAFGRTQ